MGLAFRANNDGFLAMGRERVIACVCVRPIKCQCQWLDKCEKCAVGFREMFSSVEKCIEFINIQSYTINFFRNKTRARMFIDIMSV